MIIGITSDHRGFEIKKEIIKDLKNKNIDIKDNGCFTPGSCDYSLYGISLAEEVANNNLDYGIVKGIRCARVVNKEEARLARSHNDANMLALSAANNLSDLVEIIETFITTEFSNEERHIKRIEKITNYENQLK